jgi:uncharacterized protein YcnI
MVARRISAHLASELSKGGFPMNRPSLPSRLSRASALGAAAVGLLAVPAAASVNIPEGGAVPADSVSVFHFRVLDGCGGEATDTIAVEIPEAVRNVVPASVPGWTVEVETVGEAGASVAPAPDASPLTTDELDETEQVAVVRWTGGPLPAGQFMDFGMRAYFPDEAGMTVAFPVTQTCGLTEIRWDGEAESENPAPTVSIGDHVGQRDLGELAEAVATLSSDLATLTEQLEGVDPADLQERTQRVEDRLPALVQRLNRLAERIGALEDSSAGGAEPGTGEEQTAG